MRMNGFRSYATALLAFTDGQIQILKILYKFIEFIMHNNDCLSTHTNQRTNFIQRKQCSSSRHRRLFECIYVYACIFFSLFILFFWYSMSWKYLIVALLLFQADAIKIDPKTSKKNVLCFRLAFVMRLVKRTFFDAGRIFFCPCSKDSGNEKAL